MNYLLLRIQSFLDITFALSTFVYPLLPILGYLHEGEEKYYFMVSMLNIVFPVCSLALSFSLPTKKNANISYYFKILSPYFPYTSLLILLISIIFTISLGLSWAVYGLTIIFCRFCSFLIGDALRWRGKNYFFQLTTVFFRASAFGILLIFTSCNIFQALLYSEIFSFFISTLLCLAVFSKDKASKLENIAIQPRSLFSWKKYIGYWVPLLINESYLLVMGLLGGHQVVGYALIQKVAFMSSFAVGVFNATNFYNYRELDKNEEIFKKSKIISLRFFICFSILGIVGLFLLGFQNNTNFFEVRYLLVLIGMYTLSFVNVITGPAVNVGLQFGNIKPLFYALIILIVFYGFILTTFSFINSRVSDFFTLLSFGAAYSFLNISYAIDVNKHFGKKILL